MNIWAREEMEAEYNARFDYISELAAEHEDPCWDMDDEEVVGALDFIEKNEELYELDPYADIPF